ncbi:MAG: XapX domain-containing protein [Halodesulfurarchaeum sp.]
MNHALVALALTTGLLTGATFAFLEVPIPAPPNLAGVMGIVGIYLGYVVVDAIGVSVDVLAILGL